MTTPRYLKKNWTGSGSIGCIEVPEDGGKLVDVSIGLTSTSGVVSTGVCVVQMMQTNEDDEPTAWVNEPSGQQLSVAAEAVKLFTLGQGIYRIYFTTPETQGVFVGFDGDGVTKADEPTF